MKVKVLFCDFNHLHCFVKPLTALDDKTLSKYIYAFLLLVENRSPNMASQVPALPQSYTPGTDSVFSDQSGFFSLDSNVPGLSKVILNKLNMNDYSEYR